MAEQAARISPRILVVEDDPSDLATVQAVLTDGGYHVHPAPSGAFALRFLESTLPDLILMDVGLPDLSGFQLCATIKASARTAEIPVIFVSGADRLSDRMRAFSAGAVDYVSKPFETAEILARIGTHISLRALQLRLEERVQERTAELVSANEALRASEERYRRITESMTDYVYTVRLDGDGRTTTIHGPGSVAVTGYTPAELASDPGLWMRVVRPEDRAIVTGNASRLLAGEPFGPIEHRIVTKCGIERWVRNTPVPQYDEHGSLRTYDGLIQDITERRALQAQLLQAQKMESIGQLAGGIAHDFNNLLTAILGYAQLAQASVRHGDPVAEDINEIAKAAERAANLTSQLLAFARKQLVTLVPLSVAEAIRESQQLLRRLVREDVEIEIVLDPQAGLVVADPSQMNQLLVNLAVNAGDAMPNGGKLLIETSTQRNDAWNVAHDRPAGSAWTVLSVGDTGTGMTDEVKRHVFEPFFTTKEPGKGTGLGLATCYGIVKQMGGDIEVESNLGVGTTLRILLPQTSERLHATPPARAAASLAAPHNAATVPAAPPPGQGALVLVVEDESSVRRLIVTTLRHAGYAVLEAADGPAALEVMTSADRAIDLMVSDTVLPGLGGRQIAAEFRVRFPDANILMTSGYSVPEPDRVATSASQLPFLAKPFTPSELLERVRSILDAPVSGVDGATPQERFFVAGGS